MKICKQCYSKHGESECPYFKEDTSRVGGEGYEFGEKLEALLSMMPDNGNLARELIRSELARQRKETAEQICALTDDIEIEMQSTSMEEWRMFKRIRNTIRDKYGI